MRNSDHLKQEKDVHVAYEEANRNALSGQAQQRGGVDQHPHQSHTDSSQHKSAAQQYEALLNRGKCAKIDLMGEVISHIFV